MMKGCTGYGAQPSGTSGRGGYTLVELMMATAILTAVLSMGIRIYTQTMTHAQEGSTHLSMIGKARSAEQRIVLLVYSARAVGAKTNQLDIVMEDLTQGQLRFIDQDSDPTTLEDNILEVDPDTSVANNEFVLCNFVSPIAGEQMFRVVPSSPRTALVSFHVGERQPAGGPNLLAGQGYQGMEIRLAATPRNAKGMGQ